MPQLAEAPLKKQRLTRAEKEKAIAQEAKQRGLTKAAYRRASFFDALMSDANDYVLDRDKFFGVRLGKPGNVKIGSIGRHGLALVYSGLAWHDCPGKTEACTRICYAERGRYLMAAQRRNGTSFLYSFMARYRLEVLERMISDEIEMACIRARRLGIPVVVRIHEAGDFINQFHVRMWQRLARKFSHVKFWFFTRSNNVGGELAAALEEFTCLPNVYGRRSFDPDEIPEDLGAGTTFPAAIIAGSIFRKKRKGVGRVPGAFNCAAQLTDNEIQCVNCAMCFMSRLACRFYQH